jgi:hypothetical protein
VRVARRRAPWTEVLLLAIERGDVRAAIVEPATWHELERHPRADLAALAQRVRRASAPQVTLDLPAITARVSGLAGDRERGAQLFAQNCAVCHAHAGSGGAVGPALDGIGARPIDEWIVAVLDPSRSVEANYQMWIAVTTDERIVSGRLLAETRTSLELVDAQAAAHVLERAELATITPASVSLMPSGFESLGEQALADLFALLRGTSH